MLNQSEKICLNLSGMAIAGFCHRNVNGVEFVRNFLVENVRNMLENVRNFYIYKKVVNIARKCPKNGWKMSEI